MNASEAEIATLKDYKSAATLRAEWLDRATANHPAPQRWCWAACRLPQIEDEHELLLYLAARDGRWAAKVEGPRGLSGYVLCRTNETQGEAVIEGQTPRVSQHADFAGTAGMLVDFATQRARQDGLKRIRAEFHGAADEVDPLVSVYGDHGFEHGIRCEMVSDQLDIHPGSKELGFRSAGELGLEAFYDADALVRNERTEDARQDCETSRRIWCVDPSTDWIAAYAGGAVVGTVRVAVTRTALGVLDNIRVAESHRRRGFGRCLLARGLSALAGRTDVVWTDTDDDHPGARRFYEKAGFRVRHRHGGISLELVQS